METHACRAQSHWSNVVDLFPVFWHLENFRFLGETSYAETSAVVLVLRGVVDLFDGFSKKKTNCYELIRTSLLCHLIVCWSSVDEMLHGPPVCGLEASEV